MSIDIRTATAADVRDLLVASNDMPYPLEPVIDEKLGRNGVAGEPLIIAAFEHDRALGAAVLCGRALRLLAVARDFRRRGIGSKLLDEAARIAAPRCETLAIAGEAGNYFVPGVPEESEELLGFFDKRGCARVDEALNLTVDLKDRDFPLDDRVRRAGASDRDEVLQFIERDFGAVWAFETSHAFENDPPTLFYARDEHGVLGFSAHEANNAGLGTFGPAGVSEDRRGSGIGRALLLASLADLRRLGYDNATIPWVSSVEFYAKSCGARLAHRFIRMRRGLAEKRGS